MAGNATLGRIVLAALGVLAYKNRDRLGELFRPKETDANAPREAGEAPQQESGGMLDQILGSGGLGDLLDRFRNAGKADEVDSWVGTGPNKPLDPSHVEAAIDEETLEALTRQTGMSRAEILERLAVDLPQTVDELSPQGSLPQDARTGEPTLLDPVSPANPKMGGASGRDEGLSRSTAADRNPEGPRQAGMTPRPSDDGNF